MSGGGARRRGHRLSLSKRSNQEGSSMLPFPSCKEFFAGSAPDALQQSQRRASTFKNDVTSICKWWKPILGLKVDDIMEPIEENLPQLHC